MAWYVFALTDAASSARLGKGLTGALSFRRVPGGYALVERRADVPPLEFGALSLHQDAVVRVSALVPAILPVRFGTLLESHELDEALADREDELTDACAAVRHRVQFTWRIAGRRTKTEDGRRKTEDGMASPVQMSGADYLRSAARAAHPRPPAAFRGLRSLVGSLVDTERYQPGARAVPDTLYHLVKRADERRYRGAAKDARQASPLLVITGPWPPFAFAPEVLR